MHLNRTVTSASLFAALAHGYANPGTCSGACNVHDPSLIQRSSDKVYFRFSTGNKISYAKASSISGPWTTVGSMLPSGSSIDLDGSDDLWVRPLSQCIVANTLILCHPGPRCSSRKWCLPCVLLCLNLRIAKLSNWPGYFLHHGLWLLDRPWKYWHCIIFFQGIQCY
jgi:hypothetical protein